MGVTGLWKLLEPCGKPVPVETLEGKILAIDISIWLHQVVKGFQDQKGNALANAHLLGLFHRLCKLMYYRVRPVFVFDGCVPQLKRDTIARRQQQRDKLNSEAERIQHLLVQQLAKEQVVQQALGTNTDALLKSSPGKRPTKADNAEDAIDDMFKLPELPSTSSSSKSRGNEDGDHVEHNGDEKDSSKTSCTTSEGYDTEESSFDESNRQYAYDTNLQAIDVRSQQFRSLPAEVRHEILVDIKETRKHSWRRLNELPACSNDFSSFQMKRLLKRRAVQESLEEVQQEIGARSLTYSELVNFFTEEGIVEPSILAKASNQICSDENTRFLLVRDLKKKLNEETVKQEEGKLSIVKEENKPKPAEIIEKKENLVIEVKDDTDERDLGMEFDYELQQAIALSLEEGDQDPVYDSKDYEYESNAVLHLNRQQRRNLSKTTVGPARAYMIEYAGVNEDELTGIMEETQTRLDEALGELDNSKTEKLIPEVENTIKDEQTVTLIDDSETDSDLEEVTDSPVTEEISTGIATTKTALQIVVNLENGEKVDDDMFADIFEEEMKHTAESKEQITSGIEIIPNQPSHLDGKNQCIIPIKVTPTKTTASMNSILEELKIQTEEATKINLTDILVKDNSVDKGNDELLLAQDELNTSGSKEQQASQLDVIPTKKLLLDKDGERRMPLAVPTNTACMNSILEELKNQAEATVKINLSDIEVQNTSVIELSDEEMPVVCPDQQKESFSCVTAAGLKTPNKSPRFKTPQGSPTIKEYFQTDYIIQRTPEKATKSEEETVLKVTSPFFVRKTPKISRTNSPSPTKPPSKVSKMLFDTENIPTTSSQQLPTVQETLAEVAETLKELNTAEELKEMAVDLARERRELESERNRQDRMGMSISQRMNMECQELLRLFGIPYIVAPMEAEAQCAFLEAGNLTNGTITDDSDIWLFGGRTVYKNFFAQNKHVLEFRSEKIEQNLNCDRKRLIQLACLVGSDYTHGIHGIGTVTALEILASFGPSKDTADVTSTNMRQLVMTVLNTLSRFKDWWLAHKNSAAPPGSSARLALRKKLKNIDLEEGFPSMAVVEAYMLPKVDESKEQFSWGHPDEPSIREYAKKHFGWTTSKTDSILLPVLKKLQEKKSQASIKNYFAVRNAVAQPSNLGVSKRIQSAIEKLSGNGDSDSPQVAVKEKKKSKPRTKRKQATEDVPAKIKKTTKNNSNVTDAIPITNFDAPSTSQKDNPRIPANRSVEVIPQRQKTRQQLEKNKAKAAEIMKKTLKTKTK